MVPQTKFVISVANDDFKKSSDRQTKPMVVDVSCKKELCCRHSNTFFKPSSFGEPCHDFMATITIKYTKCKYTESLFKVTRTVCLPFVPFHLRCFKSTKSTYPTLVIVCRESNAEEKRHALSSRDLNITDMVIENMASVDIQPVQRVDHISKAHRHRMCPRVRMHPYPINVCGKAFTTGSKCELNQDSIRTNIAIRQKANINKGIEINSK